MEASSTEIRTGPSTPWVLFGSLVSAAVTIAGIVAWLLLALEAALAAPWSSTLLFCGLALPGATVGAITAFTTGRRWPYFAGLAVTLIPALLYAVLPGPPPMMAD